MNVKVYLLKTSKTKNPTPPSTSKIMEIVKKRMLGITRLVMRELSWNSNGFL